MDFQIGISGFNIRCVVHAQHQSSREKIDIFFQVGKIDAFKGKIDCWVSKVSKKDYSSFRFLNEFLSEDSGVEDTAEIKELVLKHLKLLRKIFNRYFPEEESEIFCLLKWVVTPFIFPTQQQQELLDICNDINLEEIFEKNGKEYLWIFLCKREQQLQRKHWNFRVNFPNTYLCETAFSALTTIKNKNRSCLKSVDMCMRIAMSNVELRFKKMV